MRILPDTLTALPCWRGKIAAEPISGGLSNEIWKVTDDAGAHVVRFGRDYPFHHVDRAREAMTARAAHRAGFGPAVEYTAPGVMVTEFLAARTWTAADVSSNPERIGALLRDFHGRMGAEVSGAAFLFWPFHVIRDYARTMAAGDTRHARRIGEFVKLGARLEAQQVLLPVVFGHHDLLPANVLETDSRLWLIDYEYAGFGTAMFDLAGAASNAEMDDAQSLALLRAYLGAPPDDDFRRAFSAMQVASLLREAMWAMVSELHLNTPGVDFAAYAEENLERLALARARHEETYGPPT